MPPKIRFADYKCCIIESNNVTCMTWSCPYVGVTPVQSGQQCSALSRLSQSVWVVGFIQILRACAWNKGCDPLSNLCFREQERRQSNLLWPINLRLKWELPPHDRFVSKHCVQPHKPMPETWAASLRLPFLSLRPQGNHWCRLYWAWHALPTKAWTQTIKMKVISVPASLVVRLIVSFLVARMSMMSEINWQSLLRQWERKDSCSE